MKNLNFYTTKHLKNIGKTNATVYTLHRWRLCANNGRIIGASTQGYRRRIDCVRNADQVGLTLETEWRRRMVEAAGK